ncbi:MAG TPA: ATP-binding protein [Roseiflexaceae bacterium]|nr:ATP-binding protein [Roseiflexaceae bacterium]HMP40347.1 ATP-binding protein [Roseiflexaceae bacterium]
MAATPPISEAVCTQCGGVGYYKEAVDYGHPHFGVLFPCECKIAEKEQRRVEELAEISNLEAFQDKTFESFNATIHGVQRPFLRAREYARMPKGWFILFGNYGVGKTHLAAAIANELLQRHWRVLFAVVPDLLDHLRSTFGPSSEVEYDDRFELVRTVPLLVLDDLGTENTTPWAREKLFQIINYRYNETLPTVITSNRKPEDIDPRIFSRMSDRALCEEHIIIDAADYRRLSIQQRYPVNAAAGGSRRRRG